MTQREQTSDRYDELSRQRLANRRIGWLLAVVAVVIFAASLLAHS